jgi:hypothetical protein
MVRYRSLSLVFLQRLNGRTPNLDIAAAPD